MTDKWWSKDGEVLFWLTIQIDGRYQMHLSGDLKTEDVVKEKTLDDFWSFTFFDEDSQISSLKNMLEIASPSHIGIEEAITDALKNTNSKPGSSSATSLY